RRIDDAGPGILVAEGFELTPELARIDGGHRRSAMRAGCGAGESDRPAAIHAVDLADRRAQFEQFLRRELANEVLLTQELERRDEASMTAGACMVGEPRAALHVCRLAQRLAASHASRCGAQGALAVDAGHAVEEIERRTGRQLLTLERVEPEPPAAPAVVHHDGAAVVGRQRQLGHRSVASGTVHTAVIGSSPARRQWPSSSTDVSRSGAAEARGRWP